MGRLVGQGGSEQCKHTAAAARGDRRVARQLDQGAQPFSAGQHLPAATELTPHRATKLCEQTCQSRAESGTLLGVATTTVETSDIVCTAVCSFGCVRGPDVPGRVRRARCCAHLAKCTRIGAHWG